MAMGLTKQEARDRAAHAKISYEYGSRFPPDAGRPEKDLRLERYSRIVSMFDAKMVQRQRRAKQLREDLQRQGGGSEEARRITDELVKNVMSFIDYTREIKKELATQ